MKLKSKNLNEKGFVPAGLLVLLLLVGGLVFAVSRVTDLKTVLNLPKAAERRNVSTWELIYGGRNPANNSGSQSLANGSYKSQVTSRGNFADFKITDNVLVRDFTDRFDVPSCKLTNYAVKGPSVVRITNGSFSINQDGFTVSGKVDSTNSLTISSQLTNYPVPECGSGAKVNAGPFIYKVSLQ